MKRDSLFFSCQFPHWSREEIEKMLQVSDVRQTRVYQEALQEGRLFANFQPTASKPASVPVLVLNLSTAMPSRWSMLT